MSKLKNNFTCLKVSPSTAKGNMSESGRPLVLAMAMETACRRATLCSATLQCCSRRGDTTAVGWYLAKPLAATLSSTRQSFSASNCPQ